MKFNTYAEIMGVIHSGFILLALIAILIFNMTFLRNIITKEPAEGETH